MALAIAEWRCKHGISEDDPMLAVLDLVRLAVRHPAKADVAESLPPTFEEFRTTMELLDSRSKAFVNQSADLIAELRRLAQTVQRLNDNRAAALVLWTVIALCGGIGLGWLIWK